MNNYQTIELSSFKDKDAQVYFENNILYRRIYNSYKNDYDLLINSGLYKTLTKQSLLIEHTEIENSSDEIYKVIKPEEVFITYPWEWCFSQFKNAALATLKIQKEALNYGMSLKDANCYNIQFKHNKPLLIDTTSFEIYKDGEPWVAYKQFCENFLATLALMAYKDIRLNKLLISNINGIPLDLASKLLPFKTKFNLGLQFHIHMHSKMQSKYNDTNKKQTNIKISKNSQKALLDNLINCITNIKLPEYSTEWEDYYSFTNYSDESFEKKKSIILEYKNTVNPKIIWDFGANTGVFSRLFADTADEILALDIDPLAIEKNYNFALKNNEENIRPIVFDMINPSPAIGWNNQERGDLRSRAKNVDMAMALALIHHLRITYNIPFCKMAEYFSQIAPYLIIEFIEKDDSQIQKMLLNRKDVFDDYNEQAFENAFTKKYTIIKKDKITNTRRTLYLMKEI